MRLRIRRHHTPVYVVNRVRNLFWNARHADDPWLTPDSIRLLGGLLRPVDRGVEFGSGRSTPWFASRVAHLTSVETDQAWFRLIQSRLVGQGLSSKVDYRLVNSSVASHVAVARSFPKESLDFSLVDGHHRDVVAVELIDKMRLGGILVVDNAERYLPNPGTSSPSARRPRDGYASEAWKEFAERTSSWRPMWTSSGISDTAIWIRT
jgi:Predicted O-methyltransferase